jgi:divalent metal cation (Fe/Co/Zn/Cd) transporter
MNREEAAMARSRTVLPTTPGPASGRAAAVRAGVQIEIVTVVWMTIEAVVAIAAGVLARSVLLTAFGIDSVIELITGGVLLWRLVTEARGGALARVERAENRAAWVTGIGLVLLCLYAVITGVTALLTRTEPDRSFAGIAIALVAVVGMPFLAHRKRAIAARIDSAALRGDAACSITCAYMAGTLLVGLVLNAAFGWWWADSLAALALLYWLQREAREALEGARAGRGGCSCGDSSCSA